MREGQKALVLSAMVELPRLKPSWMSAVTITVLRLRHWFYVLSNRWRKDWDRLVVENKTMLPISRKAKCPNKHLTICWEICA